MTFGDKIESLRKDKKLTVLFSYLLEKKHRTYNSVNNPEIFILEIELLASVI